MEFVWRIHSCTLRYTTHVLARWLSWFAQFPRLDRSWHTKLASYSFSLMRCGNIMSTAAVAPAGRLAAPPSSAVGRLAPSGVGLRLPPPLRALRRQGERHRRPQPRRPRRRSRPWSGPRASRGRQQTALGAGRLLSRRLHRPSVSDHALEHEGRRLGAQLLHRIRDWHLRRRIAKDLGALVHLRGVAVHRLGARRTHILEEASARRLGGSRQPLGEDLRGLGVELGERQGDVGRGLPVAAAGVSCPIVGHRRPEAAGAQACPAVVPQHVCSREPPPCRPRLVSMFRRMRLRASGVGSGDLGPGLRAQLRGCPRRLVGHLAVRLRAEDRTMLLEPQVGGLPGVAQAT